MKKKNSDNQLYFDMTKQERDSAIRYLLGSILKCRDNFNMPSNQFVEDEDVNVYLAHLLFAISLPEYHDMAEPYLSDNSSEIMQWINDADDQTVCYFIFKVNADHILIHSAIFDDLNQNGERKVFKRSKKYFLELAKLYYGQAATYHKRIYRRKTGVGEVLDKMSNHFDAYEDLLKHVKREYFHFLNNYRDQAFQSFMTQMSTYEVEKRKKDYMDYFLELYGRWLENKDENLKTEIEKIAAELKKLDPSFNFGGKFGFDGGSNEEKCA